MTGLHKSELKNPVLNWIDSRMPVLTLMSKEYGSFPTPKNFNYFWNFGALAMINLAIMIVTGIFLAMNYTPNTGLAFDSVERIMRDVNYGWLLRYVHANGASMFFVVVYIHMFRAFYYGSYKAPRELLYLLGVVILLLMMATAFMGYVLPWGQMSYWGATVITNLFSAIPVVGESVVTWLWGGFSVDNPTLNRFFSLHYLLPFMITGVVFLHIVALHITGSNNPLGIDVKSPQDTIPFHPYYTVKDSVGVCVFLLIFAVIVFFAPNYLGHVENYIPANPLATPADIVPEWYFLPFYAILRSVPSKLGGVSLMFGAIAVLFLLPWLDTSPVRSARFRPIYRQLIWVLVLSVIVLGMVGAHRPEGIWVVLGRVATAYYFLHFLVLLPLLGVLERPLPLPESISSPVLRKKDPSRPGWRRTAALWRCRQADGEDLMRLAILALSTILGGGFLGTGYRGRPGNRAAGAALLLRRSVRHVRPGLRPARLPGLQGGLRELPLDEGSLLPQPGGHRPDARAGEGRRVHHHRLRQHERRRPAGRPPRPAGGPFPLALPERQGGPRRQQRRPAAGPVGAREGARGRPQLHRRPAERLSRPAGRGEDSGRAVLQRVFPRPPDRDAAAAAPTARSPTPTAPPRPSSRCPATSPPS